jgi:hypothetical protein
MTSFLDCSGCGRLYRDDEPRCPFCASRLRRADLPARLVVGFLLGAASTSCGDKPNEPTSDPTIDSGLAYAGPPPETGFETEEGTTTLDASTGEDVSTGTTEPTSGTSGTTGGTTEPTTGTGTGTETEGGSETETGTGTGGSETGTTGP